MTDKDFETLLILLPLVATAGAMLTLVALLWTRRKERKAISPASTPVSADVTTTSISQSAAAGQPGATASGVGPRKDVGLPRAAEAGPAGQLAELHLREGENLLALGQLTAAAAQLRKSILAAASLKQNQTHAAARLLLGDIAEREGDLTTACEHWQIARSLFQDLDASEQLKAAQKRMYRTNCPTDWVLNDF